MRSLSTLASVGVLLCLCKGVSPTTLFIITPSPFFSLASDQVDMSCLPQGINAMSKEVLLVSISKDGGDPIAEIHREFHATKGQGQTNLKVSGRLSQDISESYLNVTLPSPTKKSAGKYTCLVQYLNTVGGLTPETVTANLTFDDSDISSLEKTLKEMWDRQKTLMEQVDKLKGARGQTGGVSGDILERLERLENMTSQGGVCDLSASLKKCQSHVTKEDQWKNAVVMQLQILTDKVSSLQVATDNQAKEIQTVKNDVSTSTGSITSNPALVSDLGNIKDSLKRLDNRVISLERAHTVLVDQINQLRSKDGSIQSQMDNKNADHSNQIRSITVAMANLSNMINNVSTDLKQLKTTVINKHQDRTGGRH